MKRSGPRSCICRANAAISALCIKCKFEFRSSVDRVATVSLHSWGRLCPNKLIGHGIACFAAQEHHKTRIKSISKVPRKCETLVPGLFPPLWIYISESVSSVRVPPGRNFRVGGFARKFRLEDRHLFHAMIRNYQRLTVGASRSC
jgi:hypothetical protein